MTTAPEWNDEIRDDLLAELRADILGELRLQKREPESIPDLALETMLDELPEEHVPAFEAYAKQQLEELQAAYAAEQQHYPAETDSDRLDAVQRELQASGILLWQASPCCNTCTDAELPDRLADLDEDEPGFSERCRGYAYFHDQTLPEELSESTELSVYMAYGWFTKEEGVSKAEYQKQAVGIGREVTAALTSAGFKVDWSGELKKKIRLSLNWQRRTPLR